MPRKQEQKHSLCNFILGDSNMQCCGLVNPHSAACNGVLLLCTFMVGSAQVEYPVEPGIRIPRIVSAVMYANTTKSWHTYVLKMSEILHSRENLQNSFVDTLGLLCFTSSGLLVRTFQLQQFDFDFTALQEVSVEVIPPLGMVTRDQSLVSYYLHTGTTGFSYDFVTGQYLENKYDKWAEVCLAWHFSLYKNLQLLLSFDKILFSSYASTACQMGAVSLVSFSSDIHTGKYTVSQVHVFSNLMLHTAYFRYFFSRIILLLWTVSIHVSPPKVRQCHFDCSHAGPSEVSACCILHCCGQNINESRGKMFHKCQCEYAGDHEYSRKQGNHTIPVH